MALGGSFLPAGASLFITPVLFSATGERYAAAMLLFVIKAIVSGLLVAAISTIARRYPGWGGLVASLPLVSLLSMMWLYGETRDPESVARLSLGAFWFFLPSVPMFLVIPALLRAGVGFVATMAIACVMTMILYAAMSWVAPRVGIAL